MSKKTIYISYNWEDNIDNMVKKICNDLSDVAIVIFDKERMKQGTIDISRWINDNMLDADYVGIIVTPGYIKKANLKYREGVRSGVEIENDYIIKRFQNKKNSLIPIIAMKEDGKIHLPNNIEELSYYDLTSEKSYENEVLRIKQVITNQEYRYMNQSLHMGGEEYSSRKLAGNKTILQVNCSDIIPRLSSAFYYKDCTVFFDHCETVHLFKDLYIKQNWNDGENLFVNNKLSIPYKKDDEMELKKIVKIELEKYIQKLHEYEAVFEAGVNKLIDGKYYYKIVEVKRKFCEMMIATANKYDWDEGKTEWNIFQRNNNMIHVFSPVISYNKEYNSGEHAIFHICKSDNVLNDSVIIYVDINDMIGYEYKKENMNKRDRWGVKTASNWLLNEFIPFVCIKNKISESSVVLSKCCFNSNEVFSDMQMFYMCNKVKVTKNEIHNLIKSLSYCLSKKYDNNQYEYIFSKLGIHSKIEKGDKQRVAQHIIGVIEGSSFASRISNDNNSLADDLLRCIRVFTEPFSDTRLDKGEYEYIQTLNDSLIRKMNNVNLLDKYCF